MKSKVFKLAHLIKSNFATWSQALKVAWRKIKLEAGLAKGIVCFSFVKKSTGEETMRYGSTNKDTYQYEFKGLSRQDKWYIVKFWDNTHPQKYGWKSLDIRNLTKVYWSLSK